MPAVDGFSDFRPGLSSPLVDAENITPSDSATLQNVTRAIFVGGSGDLSVALAGGDTVVLRAVQGGTCYPLRVSQVFATGTTATYLVGLS